VKYKLSNLIDTEKSQKLLESFCDVVGIAAAIIDLDGDVLVGSRWQRICTDFHRVNEETCQKCIESDTQLANALQRGKPFSIYKCQNGLTDAASPIIIEGEHVANAFVGQFFLEKPNRDSFIARAALYGFEETEYLDALSQVPVVMEENLPPILNFLTTFAEMIAIMGIDRFKQIKAAEALLESEKKFSKLFQSAPVYIAFTALDDGVFLEVNDAFTDITGYERCETIGRTPLELGMWPEPDERRKFIRMAQQHGGFHEVEVKLSKKNGEPLFGLWSAERIELLGESCLISVLIDITDRKLAEEALSASHRILQSLLDAIPDLLIVMDRDFRIKFTNDKGHDLITQPDKQKQGTCYGRFKLLDEPCEDCSAMPVFETGSIVEREMVNPADDRAREVRAFPIFDSAGKVELVCEHVRDVTDRKLAEDALRESEEKYRLLIENATDAIFIAQDGVIKFANPRAEYVTGYSGAQLAKLPFIDFVHPEDRNMVLERHHKRLDGREAPNIYSFRIVNKTGEILSVELNVVLINWEGKPATLNFLRDISVQRKLEAQLQQAQRMEALGTLAGGIAHDFNNRLMAIQGRTSIVLMNKDSSHPDFEHLRGVENHVESAADLTKQLLAFARGGKYEVKPTDLNELIQKENRMFGRTKKEIRIHGKYEKNIWSVEIDRGQIGQVLLNLYVNAWQAMPGGGELYIETENIKLDKDYLKPFSVKSGDYVKISVTDTGTGMDKSTQEKIFDPFFSTKPMGRGTGLGLASAYGIIKNHGGFINVYSEKGHGSIFNIYLPASEKEIIEEKKLPGETMMGSETVLFVDDEAMIIEIAEEMFNRLGYKVLTAGSGKEAISIFKENKERIDIVLLDMIMPNMSGVETYDRIKDINPKVKVLLSSGYSVNGQATEILNRGCNGFIQKPFRIDALSKKLREILDENVDQVSTR